MLISALLALSIGATARTSDNWLESSFGFDDLLKGLGNEERSESSTLLIIPSASTSLATDAKSEEYDRGAEKTSEDLDGTVVRSGRHLHRRKVRIL